MLYATAADITDLYGPDALVVADRNGMGVADAVAVDRAIASASAEIDAYIGTRYALPLPSTPAHLVTICIDIAVYRLALSADVLTDEHRRRYDDARAFLKMVSTGTATLQVIAATEGTETDAAAISGPRPIVAGGPERLFTRETLRDV